MTPQILHDNDTDGVRWHQRLPATEPAGAASEGARGRVDAPLLLKMLAECHVTGYGVDYEPRSEA